MWLHLIHLATVKLIQYPISSPWAPFAYQHCGEGVLFSSSFSWNKIPQQQGMNLILWHMTGTVPAMGIKIMILYTVFLLPNNRQLTSQATPNLPNLSRLFQTWGFPCSALWITGIVLGRGAMLGVATTVEITGHTMLWGQDSVFATHFLSKGKHWKTKKTISRAPPTF